MDILKNKEKILKYLNSNIGIVEQGLRIIAGAFLLAFGHKFQTLWGLLGWIPLLTGVFGFCPLYYFVREIKAKKNL